jgi:hypothetical protein
MCSTRRRRRRAIASICFEATVPTRLGHFANAWEVLASDGSVLATRTLLHHSDEQPVARSLTAGSPME